MTPLLTLQELNRGAGRALLAATQAIGFSQEVARAGLRAEFEAWTTPGVLEEIAVKVSEIAPETRPKAVLIIAAGTLPASTLRHVLFARLLGAQVFLKCATGQEEIGQAIEAADDGIFATHFSRDDVHALRSAIDQVDTVVALGSDASLEDIKGHVPFHKTFVGYGHKVSAAWIDTPSDEDLEGLAADILMWDQAGCISPQVLWTRANPHTVAQELARHVASQEKTLPMTLGPWATRERRVAEVLGHMKGQVEKTRTTAIASLDESPFRPSPRHRFLWVLPADEAALQAVGTQLSTLALSGVTDAALPAHVRTCTPGQMQRPPLGWKQDGEEPLFALLRSS